MLDEMTYRNAFEIQKPCSILFLKFNSWYYFISYPEKCKKYVDFHMPKIWQVMKHIDNSVHQAYKVQ